MSNDNICFHRETRLSGYPSDLEHCYMPILGKKLRVKSLHEIYTGTRQIFNLDRMKNIVFD